MTQSALRAGLPLRMVVTDLVSKPSLSGKLGVAGKVDSGALLIGARVYVLPSGAVATVRGLEQQGRSVEAAAAGAAVEVGLTGVQAEDVAAGACLCHPEFPVRCAQRLKVRRYPRHHTCLFTTLAFYHAARPLCCCGRCFACHYSCGSLLP